MKKPKTTKKPVKRESPIVFLVRDTNVKNFVALESPNGTGSYTGYFRKCAR